MNEKSWGHPDWATGPDRQAGAGKQCQGDGAKTEREGAGRAGHVCVWGEGEAGSMATAAPHAVRPASTVLWSPVMDMYVCVCFLPFMHV